MKNIAADDKIIEYETIPDTRRSQETPQNKELIKQARACYAKNIKLMFVMMLPILVIMLLQSSINLFIINTAVRTVLILIINFALFVPMWFGVQHLCWRIYNGVPSTAKDMFFVYQSLTALKGCAAVSAVFIGEIFLGVVILQAIMGGNNPVGYLVALVGLGVMLYVSTRLTLFTPFLLSSEEAKAPFNLVLMSISVSRRKIFSCVKFMIASMWWVWLLIFGLMVVIGLSLAMFGCDAVTVQIISVIVDNLMQAVLVTLYSMVTAAYASKFFEYKRRNNQR